MRGLSIEYTPMVPTWVGGVGGAHGREVGGEVGVFNFSSLSDPSTTPPPVQLTASSESFLLTTLTPLHPYAGPTSSCIFSHHQHVTPIHTTKDSNRAGFGKPVRRL